MCSSRDEVTDDHVLYVPSYGHSRLINKTSKRLKKILYSTHKTDGTRNYSNLLRIVTWVGITTMVLIHVNVRYYKFLKTVS